MTLMHVKLNLVVATSKFAFAEMNLKSYRHKKAGISAQTGKTPTTRICETGVSRHHWAPIEGPLKPLGPSQHYHIGGFKRDPQLGLYHPKRR